MRKDTEYDCVQCGTHFLRPKASARNNPRFCSRSCANRGRAGTKYKLGGGWAYRRAKVIAENGNFCALCGQGPEWNGRPLQLQMDHIDGVHANNDMSNLRMLCPNCHTQTETYSGRNTYDRIR